MKSKPYVLYLVLGAAAVALWLAWHSARGPAVRKAAPFVLAPSPPPTDSETPLPSPAQLPTVGAPSVSATVAVVPLPAGTIQPTVGIASGQVARLPGTAPITGDPAPDVAAQTDVGRVRHMISDFHTLLNENPVGTNAEIMKQVMGGNSHQATLGPPEGMSLNPQGELVDQWGTPYFFHQLSRDKMEVRSAGPDKVMWTADDVIAR